MSVNSQLHNSQRPRRVSGMLVVLGVGLLGVGSFAGCATAQAARVADGPPLEVPAAPVRVIAPIEESVIASPTPVPEPESTASTPAAARPAAPRPAAQPPAAATAPPPAAAPPPDNRVLAAPTTNAVSEQSVRAMLSRANQNLARLNRQRLSGDGQANYDQARRFAQQAEQALRERNVVFAATLADKAETLAAELTRR